MKKIILTAALTVAFLAGGTAAYAGTLSLQSGGYGDHVLVDHTNATVGPGGVGDSVACPEGYYVTGGGYEFSAFTTPTVGFRPWFNGPVSGWAGVGTAWSIAGETDVAGSFTVWASCLELT